MHDKIKLSKEKRETLIVAIQTYFLNERGEDLGELGAALILDFFLEILGPEIYNLGIADSYHYFQNRLEDLWEIQIFS